MDWNKAKNFTIAFLIIINLILLGLNVYKHSGNTVGSARLETITSLAKKNDITIGCALPNKHPDMPRVTIQHYNFDYLQLEKIFFNTLNDIARTDENDSSVFTNGTATLTITGNRFKYTDKSARDSSLTSANIAERYAADINTAFGNFKLDSVSASDGGIRFMYYDCVGSFNIFSSYLSIYLPTDGGIEVDGCYDSYAGTSDERYTTIASDEAVYAAFSAINEANPNKSVTITSVTQGYYYNGEAFSDEEEAVPFYLIMANGKQFFVNACNGEVFVKSEGTD
jgi:hypothetical protein